MYFAAIVHVTLPFFSIIFHSCNTGKSETSKVKKELNNLSWPSKKMREGCKAWSFSHILRNMT